MEIVIRHAEPDDYEAIYRILSGPRLVSSLRFSLWYSLILSRRAVLGQQGTRASCSGVGPRGIVVG
jgi:hypothetical protein